MYNKTIIEFGFRMISWIIKTSCLWYLPQPLDLADHTDLGFDNSWYHAQSHPIIIYCHGYCYCYYYFRFMFHLKYQTRETVFYRDIQTPRMELKVRRQADFRCFVSSRSGPSSFWSARRIATSSRTRFSEYSQSFRFVFTSVMLDRPLPDFKSWRTMYESVNYGISNYWSS